MIFQLRFLLFNKIYEQIAKLLNKKYICLRQDKYLKFKELNKILRYVVLFRLLLNQLRRAVCVKKWKINTSLKHFDVRKDRRSTGPCYRVATILENITFENSYRWKQRCIIVDILEVDLNISITDQTIPSFVLKYFS